MAARALLTACLVAAAAAQAPSGPNGPAPSEAQCLPSSHSSRGSSVIAHNGLCPAFELTCPPCPLGHVKCPTGGCQPTVRECPPNVNVRGACNGGTERAAFFC